MDICELDELALVGGNVGGPKGVDGGEIIVRDRTATGEGYLERLELLFGPTNPNPQNAPSAAQIVDVGEGPGGLERTSVRHTLTVVPMAARLVIAANQPRVVKGS